MLSRPNAMPRFLAGSLVLLIAGWRGLLRRRPYHPERHYMRGPGPASRSKGTRG